MIHNIEELKALRDDTLKSMSIRLDRTLPAGTPEDEIHILVCGVAGCASSGSLEVARVLEERDKSASAGCEGKGHKDGMFRSLC